MGSAVSIIDDAGGVECSGQEAGNQRPLFLSPPLPLPTPTLSSFLTLLQRAGILARESTPTDEKDRRIFI